MRTIATINAKGGSGKTTVALHLAVASVQLGHNVAVIDLDPQQTARLWSDRRSSPSPVVLQVAPSRLGAELERAAATGADMVLIDAPPRAWLGADNAAREAAKVSDLVVVPTRPTILDLEATATTIERIGTAIRTRVTVVLNGCPARGRDANEAEAALADRGVDVCPFRIGHRVAFARSLLDGLTAQEVEPRGKAAQEIARVHTFVMRTQAD
jgi:chromosome partitioning protein